MTYSPNETTATEVKAQIMFVTKLFKVQQHSKLFFLYFLCHRCTHRDLFQRNTANTVSTIVLISCRKENSLILFKFQAILPGNTSLT